MKHFFVDILLPTYNGEPFLATLLESLVQQTATEFRILTYDDASTDDSEKIIDSFSKKLHIERIPNNTQVNRGARESFHLLMQHATSSCVMFCDQDDIWKPPKIERGLKELRNAQNRYGAIPILIFSDLEIIDTNNACIADSFITYSGVNTACIADPYYLIFRNPAPGCSIIVNALLIKATLPIDEKAIMHDWWMIIDGALGGKIIFLDEILVSYRVHDKNTLGTKPDRPLPVILSLFSMIQFSKRSLVVSRQKKAIDQGRAVFQKKGIRFSETRYWISLVLGRYFFPLVARYFKKYRKFSWRG